MLRDRRCDGDPFRLRVSRRELEPRAERDEDVDIAAVGGADATSAVVGVGGMAARGKAETARLEAGEGGKNGKQTRRGRALLRTSVRVCYAVSGPASLRQAVRVGLAGLRRLRSKSLVMVVLWLARSVWV